MFIKKFFKFIKKNFFSKKKIVVQLMDVISMNDINILEDYFSVSNDLNAKENCTKIFRLLQQPKEMQRKAYENENR